MNLEHELQSGTDQALDGEEDTYYRAIRVLVIEGSKAFVRETLKRSLQGGTAFLEQGGTVSYRSTKIEKVMEIEEAELGE